MVELTEQQKMIVEATEPKIVVVATAAAGKTRCITERVRWLLKQGVPGDEIVTITFTNAAAEEISERLGNPAGVFIGTIHSLANFYLRSGGVLLVNDEKILPMPCITGAAKYPEDVKAKLLSSVPNAVFVPAQEWAIEAGSAKAANVVMLGAMCRLCGFHRDVMTQAVESCVPQKFLELNLKAFAFGYERV